MKCIFLIALLFTSLSGCSAEDVTSLAADEYPGAQYNSPNFTIVLYDDVSSSIVETVKQKLEQNYERVHRDLMAEMDTSKTIVRIWGNEAHFLNDMESSLGIRYTGATGYVYNKREARVLYIGLQQTAQNALHEFCHIVSQKVNGTIGNNPRWLWEAVALYEAGDFVDPKSISYLAAGNFPSILELNSSYSVGNMKIYQVGYLISEYIISVFGKEKFVDLIKSNGNISATLSVTTAQFEAGWKQFVQDKYFNSMLPHK